MGLARTEYSSFQVHKIVPDDMDGVAPIDLPFNPPGTQIKVYGTEINEPAAQVAIEDFLPGTELTWVFPHDEVQYCLSGRAEIEIHMPPLYQEVKRAILEPGCVYLLPQGGRMRIKVLDDVPFRHVCICFPNPSYPFEGAASIRG